MSFKTRNPGAAGTAHGERALLQTFGSKNTLPQSAKPEQAASTRLSVADGQTTVGFIDVVGGRWRASLPNGTVIGTFKTQLEATRSLPKRRARS